MSTARPHPAARIGSPAPRNPAGAALRALLSLVMALALVLFVAPAAPDRAPRGGEGHRAWLVAGASGPAGLHQRETALRQSIAPQAEPLALPPPQGPAPRAARRWGRVRDWAACRRRRPGHRPARHRARAPPRLV